MNNSNSNYNSQRNSTTSLQDDGNAERHSLQTYVSDLLALEKHIGQALEGQVRSDDVASQGQAAGVIGQIKAQNESHIAQLQRCLDRLGGHPASPVKSAWASLLGSAASAIGGSRKTKVTKWLRDDYTALSLANVSYTLLHATAVGLGDSTVSALARQGLTDYSRSVMLVNQVIPGVVLTELRDDGENVATGAAETIRQQTNEIWKNQSAVTNN
jgi:ferritin-like metal-binding protein YciE